MDSLGKISKTFHLSPGTMTKEHPAQPARRYHLQHPPRDQNVAVHQAAAEQQSGDQDSRHDAQTVSPSARRQ